MGAILEAGYHTGFTEEVELEVVILEFFRSISGGRHSRQRKGYVKDIEVFPINLFLWFLPVYLHLCEKKKCTRIFIEA